MTIETQDQTQETQVQAAQTEGAEQVATGQDNGAERQAAIDMAREQIAKFGLTAQDLGLRKPRKVSAKRPPVPVKYRDEDGNVWSGRGKMATWMRVALENGRTKEDFLVA